MATDRIVVVGAGLAALRTVEALRAQGFAGSIEVYGDEPYAPYNRPPLSKRFLTTELKHRDVALRRRSNIEDVGWHLGSAVRQVDLAAQYVTLADGRTTEYDGLVAATGVRARRLSSTDDRPDCYTLRTLDDCSAVRRALHPGCTVVVLGAGFIGCEAAAALCEAGFDVHVIETDTEVMRRPLGPTLGRAVRIRHESTGVRFHLAARVVAIDGPVGASIVRTDAGHEVSCSAVIEAVGSVPNTEWLEGNGLDLSDGVLCDPLLQVVDGGPAVAAGDVARHPSSLVDPRPRRVEHWQLAASSAKRAARSLLTRLNGQPDDSGDRFNPLPWFWSDQGDVRLQAFGEPNLGDEMQLLEGRLDGDLVARFVRAETVVGVVLIGYPHEAARHRASVGRSARVETPAPVEGTYS